MPSHAQPLLEVVELPLWTSQGAFTEGPESAWLTKVSQGCYHVLSESELQRAPTLVLHAILKESFCIRIKKINCLGSCSRKSRRAKTLTPQLQWHEHTQIEFHRIPMDPEPLDPIPIPSLPSFQASSNIFKLWTITVTSLTCKTLAGWQRPPYLQQSQEFLPTEMTNQPIRSLGDESLQGIVAKRRSVAKPKVPAP